VAKDKIGYLILLRTCTRYLLYQSFWELENHREKHKRTEIDFLVTKDLSQSASTYAKR